MTEEAATVEEGTRVSFLESKLLGDRKVMVGYAMDEPEQS